MTKAEFKKLTENYVNAQRKYVQYVEQFLFSLRNGVEIKKATKVLTSGEVEKIKSLREEAGKTHQEWLRAVTSEELTD